MTPQRRIQWLALSCKNDILSLGSEDRSMQVDDAIFRVPREFFTALRILGECVHRGSSAGLLERQFNWF